MTKSGGKPKRERTNEQEDSVGNVIISPFASRKMILLLACVPLCLSLVAFSESRNEMLARERALHRGLFQKIRWSSRELEVRRETATYSST